MEENIVCCEFTESRLSLFLQMGNISTNLLEKKNQFLEYRCLHKTNKMSCVC